MNPGLIESVLLWYILPSTFIVIIAVASSMHEELVRKKNGTENVFTTPAVLVMGSSGSKGQWQQLRSQPNIIRGYDSPELFREDLWLIRIARSRKAYGGSIVSVSVLLAGAGTPIASAKSICALLAQQSGSRCDN
jgi:hypothetical protein